MPKIFLTNEDKTLHHNEQVLTDAEKAQARENIGAAEEGHGHQVGEISGLGSLATKSTVVKSDLDSDVQTSLGKADTALQSFTETDPTVPAWAKASTPPSYTANDISGLGSLATKSTVSKSDLASDVQTSLGKADTALQSFTETDPTVPAWAKADTKPSYTASEVGAAEEGHIHDEQVSFHGITTAGDGSVYTATVAGIDALTAGASFIMVPNVTSTVVTPKLNVNSLGEKSIRRRVSNSTVTTVAASSANWLYANKPIRMTYDGTYWIADLDRPNATDIYGTVPITSGGTGATTAASALTNLGLTATAAELNYVDGVTSNVQTQINSLSSEIATKANSSHSHTKSEITDFPTVEVWTFTLEDGSTVTKAVYVGEVPKVTVTITGSGSTSRAQVTIDGTTYISAATLSVPIGTAIECFAKDPDDSYARIILNGSTVKSGSSATYTYTANGNVNIALDAANSGKYYQVTITEQ